MSSLQRLRTVVHYQLFPHCTQMEEQPKIKHPKVFSNRYRKVLKATHTLAPVGSELCNAQSAHTRHYTTLEVSNSGKLTTSLFYHQRSFLHRRFRMQQLLNIFSPSPHYHKASLSTEDTRLVIGPFLFFLFF